MEIKRLTRKPRTKSAKMCECCYYANCDSGHGFIRTPYVRKRSLRLKNNLCVACGKNPCECKRREFKNNIK